MAKLNFIESQHTRMLSYVECRSDPVAEPAPKKALPGWLGDLAEAVMVVAAVLCGGNRFYVLGVYCSGVGIGGR